MAHRHTITAHHHSGRAIMSRMSVRSTYALDEDTSRKIKYLSRLWGVSQAEVIRRSVQQAAQQEEGAPMTPAEVVAWYEREALPRSAEETRKLVEAMRRARHEDDERRGGPAGP